MNAADKLVTAAIAFMFAAIPLYGAFQVFDPLRTPMPPIIGFHAALLIAGAMLLAGAICTWGLVRRPVPRLIFAAQLCAGGSMIPGTLIGFDPIRGAELTLIVLVMGIVGAALYAYAALPGVTRAVAIAFLVSAIGFLAFALAIDVARTPASLFAYNNGRAVGTFLNSNELAAYALVAVALAAALAAYGRGIALRALAGVAAIVTLVALGATYSRWGFLAAAVGVVWFAVVCGGRRAWIGVIAAVALALAVALGPGAIHHNPRDDSSRIVAWTTGVRTWLAFPLTGIGPLAYRRTYDVLRPPDAPGGDAPVAFDPHSLPLAYLSESGLIAFVALIFSWSVYAREIPRALRAADPRRRALVYAFAAGLVALNVHVLINTISIYFALALQGAPLALVLAMRDLDAPAV